MCKLLIKYPDLIVALISLTVAIALGICQVCQANRVEAFERRLNDRDEKRYKDLVYSQATQFIQKYSVGEQEAEIHLLPLCIAAYKHNLVYPYRREIYREFCGLTGILEMQYFSVVRSIYLVQEVTTIMYAA